MKKKPKKPRPDFPLFAHNNGQWAKKIRGEIRYFGRWDEPQKALSRYLAQRDDWAAGRTPIAGLVLADLLNEFMARMEARIEAGELQQRTWHDYDSTCRLLVSHWGRWRLIETIGPADFAALKRSFSAGRRMQTVANLVRRVRAIFRWGRASGMIRQDVLFGPDFRPPEKSVMRRERQSSPKRELSALQIRTILRASSRPLRAMTLLGINCGLGNMDCGLLEISHIDLEAGWINYPRHKTAVERRCPLWPETVRALRAAIESRPQPHEERWSRRVFLTHVGRPWASPEKKYNAISEEFGKLLRRLGYHAPGVGFYALRHTCETIAGASRDQVAVDAIMGHADQSMSAVYREWIDDQRLIDVTEFVRQWLFPDMCQDSVRDS